MPTEVQKKQMEQHFGCCRLVWNLALGAKKQAWESNRTKISRFDLQKQLLNLKREYDWLYDVNAQSLQSVLLHLDNSYKSFFAGNGFPKFKNKYARQSFSCPQRVDIVGKKIKIPKIGYVDIILSRTFEGAMKTITISKEPTGKYYASVLVDNGKNTPNKKVISDETLVGIDLGLKEFLITSDNTKIENPKFYKKSLKRLKCLQRRLSRKKSGSNKKRKAKYKVALQHEKVRFQRQDFLHKLSSAIVKQYDSICVEDLAVKNMVRNRKLSQSINDVGWGEFLRQLKYKCDWHGKNFLEVPRFYASSKTCSICNAVNETLALSDREWYCANCGTTHDRDVNAAKNIKQYFLTKSPEGIGEESVELLPIGRAKKRKRS